MGDERGLEYDTVSDRYTTFIETEVLPRIAQDYRDQIYQRPRRHASMGGSSGAPPPLPWGGSAPDLYRRILTYSGT